MSGPFNVGDVVVCWREPQGPFDCVWEPRVGGIYTVAALDFDPDDNVIIDLQEDPDCFGEYAWEAAAFKLIPKATEEFTAQMRALRPVKEPAL